MKNIKYMLFAVMVTVMSSFMVSCSTDGNDWETDSSYDRVFTPTSVSISTSGGVSTVSWSTYDKADFYVIEITNLNPHILTDEMPEGTALADMIAKWEAGELQWKPYSGEDPYDKVFGRDEYITGTSYIIPEQLPDGTYQLRIKACSTTGRQESHWLYLTKDDEQFFEIGGEGGEEEE
ncbi:MAG: hypothetical protein J5996_00870 [Prevotella sp.]|nr:hypothetical protein [Prevotella sp.]